MSPEKTQDMSDPSSSPWFISCTKLRFFARIRRFLKMKKRFIPSDHQFDNPKATINCDDQEEDTLGDGKKMKTEQSEEAGADEDDMLVVLQRSVKRLHFGRWEEKEKAAEEILRLVKDGPPKLRKTLAELGVVPPLVEMVGSSDGTGRRRRLAVQALIELANGTFTTKILMVEADILTKFPDNVDVLDESTRHDMAQLLLFISSLPNNNQYPLNYFIILPFLLSTLVSNSNLAIKDLCLATLYNLSTMLDQAGSLATNKVVHTLLSMSSAKETSEKALATLGNLVVTTLGKKELDNNPMVPQSLIEILTWDERPKCQELSAYILMILAHQSSAQRQKMAKLGIVTVLLEVALLGSPLAQKRALKLLQWFKDERYAKIGPHSGPQAGRMDVGSPVNEREIELGRKMMKSLVKQSLDKNMEMITRRACASEDSSSKLKALVSASSSKSLPY